MTASAAPPLVEIAIAAPARQVWTALREPALLKQWFGWDAASLDEEIRYIFLDHATADEGAGRVQFEPWEGKADAFELEDRGDHSLLRVVRTGADADADWDAAFDDLREGWTSFLHQLRLALERHPGEPRRTLYLSGRPRRSGAREALGLAALPASGRFALQHAPGGALDGEVWSQRPFQTVAMVDGWNDGLLAVIDKPGGGSQATLTTYGLDDASFAALETAWRGWWAERFDTAG